MRFQLAIDRMRQLQQHRLFMLMLALYVLTAGWLSFRLPAFIAPNEQLHYEYVALLRRTGRLPDPASSARPDERHQPPVYYALAALMSLPFSAPPLDTELETNPHFFGTHEGNRNPVVGITPVTAPVLYLGRLVSVCLGALGVLVMYAAAYQVFRSEVALLVASLIAFQPMFLFLSAAVTNDLAVVAIGTLVVAWTVLLIVQQRGERDYFLWGILFALAVLTKASAVFLFTLLPIACLTRWHSQGRLWPAARCACMGVLGFVPLFAVWAAANLQRNLDAFAVSDSLPPLGRILSVGPSDLAFIQPHLLTLWRSFWLDWSQNETGYTADWFYAAWGIALIVALVGWLRQSYRWKKDGVLPLMHAIWVLPLCLVFIAIKTLMIKGMGFLTPEGRWLLPVLPSLAWLAATGWSRWWPAHRQRKAAVAASLVVVASSLSLVILFLPEIYPEGAERFTGVSSIPSDVHRVGLIYNRQVELAGIASTPLVADQRGEVTLYWKTLWPIETNYSVSTLLVVPDPDGWRRLDLQRSFPGNGLTPTRGWRPEELYRDQVVFYPHGELDGPTTALITIELFDGSNPVPATIHGKPVEVAIAQEVVVRPGESLVAPADDRVAPVVNFGGLFNLVGLAHTDSDRGLEVTLWWQAQAETQTSYTVFIHLIDQQGQLIAQADGLPNDGLSPTLIWRTGDVIRDTHEFPVRALPHSVLLIGVYDLATLDRLPAVQGAQPLLNDSFRFELP